MYRKMMGILPHFPRMRNWKADDRHLTTQELVNGIDQQRTLQILSPRPISHAASANSGSDNFFFRSRGFSLIRHTTLHRHGSSFRFQNRDEGFPTSGLPTNRQETDRCGY